MSYPYIMTNDSITVVLDGGIPKQVHSTHPNFDQVKEAIRDQDWEAVPDLIDIPRAVARYANGAVEVLDDGIYYRGEPLHNAVTERILQMMREGFEIDPLVKFLERLLQNPSKRAVDGLFQWLERSQLPIMPDGRFVAYKIVTNDFKDVRTETFDNTPGQTVEMPRNEVDDNPDRTCSTGLHFCSANYLPHYGPSNQKVVAVAIDPADVVAFPPDYNISKGRCARYEVLHELPKEEAARFFEDRNATLVYGWAA